MVRTCCFALVTLAGAVSPLVADDWPQWFGPSRDGVWREDGILKKFPAEGVKPVWKTPLGAGYSGPAVANGFVYVMDRQGAKPIQGNPAKGTSGDGIEMSRAPYALGWVGSTASAPRRAIAPRRVIAGLRFRRSRRSPWT